MTASSMEPAAAPASGPPAATAAGVAPDRGRAPHGLPLELPKSLDLRDAGQRLADRLGAPARAVPRLLAGELARDLGAAGILAGATLAMFWPAIAHGLVAYENDTRIFYYPLFTRLGEAVKQGLLPLWSPQIFGGYPIFADGEAGTLYPVHLLALLLLPAETAFLWSRPIRFFQGAIFTYLFCRTIGLGRFGAVIGALGFAFGGFAIAQLHHTNISTSAVWLPLELAFAELAIRSAGRRRYAFAILAGVAFGLQGLIIHVQVVLMSALAFAAYCAYRCALGPVAPASQGPYQLARRWVARWRGAGFSRPVGASPWPGSAGHEHGPRRLRLASGLVGRLGLAAALVAIAGVTGAGLSAVQLLPLYELSTFSARGGGVDYAFATQYSLPPVQLISLLLPNFFVTNGQYWGLWSRWEVFVYTGITPLLLAVVAVAIARHRLIPLFLAMAAISIALALGESSPFGLHHTLAELPGFSVLRAPGRFTFLFTFSVALLAAIGADALRREFGPAAEHGLGARAPVRRVARQAVLSATLLALQLAVMAVPLLVSLASSFVEAHKDIAVTWLQGTLMRQRGFDTRLTAEQLYQYLVASLDPVSPAVLRQVGLLLVTVATLVMWDRVRPLSRVWQGVLAGLVAVDLIGLGQQFHPKLPLAALAEPGGVAGFLAQNPGLYRVFSQKGTRDEPNRLLSSPVMEANGYSSLEPVRHQQYAAVAEYAPNRLLDLMNVRYYAVKNVYTGAPSYNLTSFNPRKPLLSSTGRNPAGSQSFNLAGAPADRLRVVSALRWAVGVAQGAEVARITAWDTEGRSYAFRLLAGQHTAEWAWERPDLRGKVQHQLPPVAWTWQQQDGRAPPFPAHLYYAEFPLGRSVRLRRVDVQFTHPTAQVDLYGLAAFDDTSKDLEQLDQSMLAKFRRVYADADVVLYENQDYLPRAFLVGSAIVERPGDDILARMAHGDFSPERFVILEEQFDTTRLAPPPPAGQPVPPIRFNRPQGTESTSGAGSVQLLRFDADYLRLEARASQNALLFLADLIYPGWIAYVDGKETPIYRANYLFRAVYVPAGQHTVEFVYRPRSFRLGVLITLLASLATVGTLAWLCLWPRRPIGATITFPGTSLRGPAVPGQAGHRSQQRSQPAQPLKKGSNGDGRQESEEYGEEGGSEEGGSR